MHLTELGLREGSRPALALAHSLTVGTVPHFPRLPFPHLHHEGLAQSRDFKGGKDLRALGPQLQQGSPMFVLHSRLPLRFCVKKVFCGCKIKTPMAFLLFE